MAEWLAVSTVSRSDCEDRVSYDVVLLQEWTDYDENAQESVSVMELESQFVKAHK